MTKCPICEREVEVIEGHFVRHGMPARGWGGGTPNEYPCRHSGVSEHLTDLEITEVGGALYIYGGLTMTLSVEDPVGDSSRVRFGLVCCRCRDTASADVPWSFLRRIYKSIPSDPSPRTLLAKLEVPRKLVDGFVATHMCMPAGRGVLQLPLTVLDGVDTTATRAEQLEVLATNIAILAREAGA